MIKDARIFTLLFGLFLGAAQLMSQTVKTLEAPESFTALYVPEKDKIYVLSFNPEGSAFASFLVVNPYEGLVEDIIPLSLELDITEHMKLSADGKLIYMVSNTGDVLCFDIATSSVKFQFRISPLVQNFISGIRFLEVSPTDPNTYMIGWWERTSPAITAIFDGNQMRPNFLQIVNWAAIFPETDTLAYFTDSNGSLVKAAVTNQGLSEIETYPQILDEEFQQVAYHNGQLFVENGKVFDLSATNPQLLGNIPLSFTKDFDSGSPAIVVDTSQQAVYYIHYQLEDITFYPFNLQNYAAEEAFILPVDDGGAAYSVVEPWGSEQNLALLVDFFNLILVRNCTAQLNGEITILADSLVESCSNQLVKLEASSVADGYLWSNGDTSRIIEVPFDQILSVQGIDGTGCLSTSSGSVQVKYLPVPGTPSIQAELEVRESIEICFGEAVELKAISFENRYEWSTGDTLETINVNEGGTYRVRAISDRGCAGPWSTPFEVIIKADTIPPAPGIAISIGDSLNCMGDLVELEAEEGFFKYIWSDGIEAFEPRRRVVFPGGLLSVSSESRTGCQGPFSDTLPIFFSPVPIQPTIATNGFQLFSNFNNGNQWFFNGNPIFGAVDSVYLPTMPGFYSVQVTINGCTSPMSELWNYMVTATEEVLEPANLISVFPNPTKDIIHIQTELAEPLRMELFSINGQKLMEKNFLQKMETSVSSFAKGFYLLRCVTEKGALIKTEKILIY